MSLEGSSLFCYQRWALWCISSFNDTCNVFINWYHAATDSLYLTETSNWTKVPADKSSPRDWRLVLARTKTDAQGTGPIADRTSMLRCICLTHNHDKLHESISVKVWLQKWCSSTLSSCCYNKRWSELDRTKIRQKWSEQMLWKSECSFTWSCKIRYTASSICMNNNIDSVVSSMATKHQLFHLR